MIVRLGIARVGVVCIGLMCIGLAALLGSVESSAHPIAGYLDPHTGVFTPVPASPLFAPSARVTTIKGTLVITATITLDPNVSAGDTVNANCLAATNDPVSAGSVGLRETVQHSGSTATVTFTMPFLFAVTSTSDKLRVELTVAAETASGSRDQMTTVMLPMPKSGTNAIRVTGGV